MGKIEKQLKQITAIAKDTQETINIYKNTKGTKNTVVKGRIVDDTPGLDYCTGVVNDLKYKISIISNFLDTIESYNNGTDGNVEDYYYKQFEKAINTLEDIKEVNAKAFKYLSAPDITVRLNPTEFGLFMDATYWLTAACDFEYVKNLKNINKKIDRDFFDKFVAGLDVIISAYDSEEKARQDRRRITNMILGYISEYNSLLDSIDLNYVVDMVRHICNFTV